MSRKFKYNSVIQDDHFSQIENYKKLNDNHDSVRDKICLRCESNEKSWNLIKSMYKAIEFLGILSSISLSVLSLVLSVLFFQNYRIAFGYIDEIGLMKYYISRKLPLVYAILESGGLAFDFIRAIVSINIFWLFANEQSNKKGTEQNMDKTILYFMDVPEETQKNFKLIENLKMRNDLKIQLKKMFNSMIRLEVVINLYHCIFVIAPKILTASYLQYNVVNEFKRNVSEALEMVSY